MATATRTEHVTLGGLLLATTAIDCFDWADLLSRPEKRGTDIVIPGAPGVLARGREQSALRAVLQVRIDGRWVHDTGASTGATVAAWREGAYDAWALLTAKDLDTTQTLLLTYPGGPTASADCQVLEVAMSRQPAPYLWFATVDVLLPDGGLL